MRRVGMAVAAALTWTALAGAPVSAQVPIGALETPITQNFDSLANTGASNTQVPSGWAFVESGANADTFYASSTGGGSGAANTYSFGPNNDTNRAFGAIASNTLEVTIGAEYENATGETIAELDISYFGEWYRGGDAASDPLVFEYSLNATSLTTGTWTAVGSLAFSHLDVPCHGNDACGNDPSKEGNTAPFRAQKSGTISGLALADGDTLWIRWRDTNAVGADHGLAVDDLSLVAHAAEPVDPPVVTALKDVDVVGAGAALPGAVLEYEILFGVDETSPQGVDALVFTDELPDGVTAITDPADPDYLFTIETDVITALTAADDADAGDITAGVVTVEVGAMEIDSLTSIVFRVRVDETANAFTLSNTATLAYDGEDAGVDFATESNAAAINVVACLALSDCDDDNVCTTEACTNGSCSTNNNAAPCDDGDACSLGDVCVGGACTANATANCNDDDPCTDDSCDSATGCVNTNNTAPCDDGNPCTLDDTCAEGECAPDAAADCDDDNVCTTDACDPVDGCSHEDNTEACDDGMATTYDDVCAAGACAGTAVVCDTPNQCQVAGTPDGTASCPPVPKDAGEPCDDGDDGTVNDACDGAGACLGTSTECPADTACATYEFDGETCVVTELEGPCDDGDVNTRDDVCVDGGCIGTLYACEPSQCEASSVANGVDCTVTNEDAGVACDDGAVDTRNDVCDGAGNCGGEGYVCTPGVCEANSEPDGVGCVVTPAAAGMACDDGDPCSDGDVCDADGGCSGEPLCGAGEICNEAGECETTHCSACEQDEECGADSACVELGDGLVCLVACETDEDCAAGQVCHDRGDEDLRCFDSEGACAVPTVEPDAEVVEEVEAVEEVEDVEVVEEVEEVEEVEDVEDVEVVEETDDVVESTPEPEPETAPETAPEATDAGSDGSSSERQLVVASGSDGCGGAGEGGSAPAVLAWLALVMMLAGWRRQGGRQSCLQGRGRRR